MGDVVIVSGLGGFARGRWGVGWALLEGVLAVESGLARFLNIQIRTTARALSEGKTRLCPGRVPGGVLHQAVRSRGAPTVASIPSMRAVPPSLRALLLLVGCPPRADARGKVGWRAFGPFHSAEVLRCAPRPRLIAAATVRVGWEKRQFIARAAPLPGRGRASPTGGRRDFRAWKLGGGSRG